MAKAIFLALAVTFTFAAGARDDSCPDPSALSPCTCDGEGVNCMGKVTLDQIRRAFAANFKFGGVRSIWIQGTLITSAPADLIGQLKAQEVFIEINNITNIDLNLLNGSTNTLNVVSLFGNQISTIDFATFGKFSKLLTLNLGRNMLTSIPANGFESFGLTTLILTQNKITDIGSNAFGRMPYLQRLDVDQNQLKTLGPNSFTIKSQNAMINLVYNQITTVSPTAFDGSTPTVLRLTANQLQSLNYEAFGSLVTRMGNRGGSVEVSANPFTCYGCDYTWIVDNKQILSNILLGFLCKDGTTIQQLTRLKIGC